jgi:hypothetical protein
VNCDAMSGIATRHGPDDKGRSSSPGRIKNFNFSVSSTPALGSIQPPIQWVQAVLSLG